MWNPLAQRPAFLSSSPPACPAVIDWMGTPNTETVTVTPPSIGSESTLMGAAALADAVPAVRASRAPIRVRTIFLISATFHHMTPAVIGPVFVTVAGVILTVNGRERAAARGEQCQTHEPLTVQRRRLARADSGK